MIKQNQNRGKIMKVLVVGDVVGRPGRNTLQAFLEKYKEDYDFVIVNGENSAAGFGITVKIADEFLSWGNRCNKWWKSQLG